MPKKPPFNHFRKSCCSPSNSNEKKNKLQVPSVPCKKYACLYHGWVCGEVEEGEQEGCFWWPCQPLRHPGTCWSCLPHKTIYWGQAPACGGLTPACSEGCVRGDYPMTSHACRENRSPCPPTLEEPIVWALGLFLYPASHRSTLFLITLGTVFPRVPMDSVATQSH